MPMTESGKPRALRTASALLALLLAGSVAACSSSKSGSSAASSAATSAAASASAAISSAVASASAAVSPGASASGTAPADPAAAKAEITANWEKFFDPATPIADKAVLLQNGDVLLPVLQGFSQDPRVGQVQAKVSDVTFTDATHATVTYALSLQGTVVEPNATGQAVLEGGTWKVGRATLCGLLTQAAGASGTPIPGCS
ncbi:hypothetical protein PUR71_32735 [Streptomyces sp. SP17BM10]|uniref:hypothetical protein n=1 Tax=Streptomyces sp. SP17BM10 TaxID=3002530 RepID=UPI002E77BFB8|nr:hypothetical protein [Streptomyces sp. SP17BM10]MEE1787639.1 hypothetical protein [Streptomyces sp. SP17BM10]